MRLLTDSRAVLAAVTATVGIMVAAGAAWLVDPPVEGPLRWAVFGVAAYWAARTLRLRQLARQAARQTAGWRDG